MSILPVGATWVDDIRKVNASVTAPGQAVYRDFAMVWQKALNIRWAGGRPVEGIAAEGLGVPTDPQDNSSMAINYKAEPLWYRFGLAPDAPFGHADGAGYADVPNAHMAYSNALVGGDPQTPVLYVKPGQPFRTHILMPTGGSRGSTFQLDGHVWSVNPFQSEKSDPGGYPMWTPGWARCGSATTRCRCISAPTRASCRLLTSVSCIRAPGAPMQYRGTTSSGITRPMATPPGCGGCCESPMSPNRPPRLDGPQVSAGVSTPAPAVRGERQAGI